MAQLCLIRLTVYLIYLYIHCPANILTAIFYMPYIYTLSWLCTYCPILQLNCLHLHFPFFYLLPLFNLLIAPWFLIATYWTMASMCLTTYSFTQPYLPITSWSLLVIYSCNMQSNYLQLNQSFYQLTFYFISHLLLGLLYI